MDWLLLMIWVLLPVLPVGLLLWRYLPAQQPGRYSLVLGYGLMAGLMLVPLGMRLLDLVGIPFSMFSIGTVMLALAAAAWFLPLPQAQAPLVSAQPLERAGKWVLGLCLALIALRLLTLGMELSLRPVFSWDSKQHWGKQARVFYELRELVPFVPLADWLQAAPAVAYTNMHPDYPVTVPMLQAWVNLPWQEWDHSRMSQPWLLTWIGLGLVAFGQLRAAGANAALAAAASYMILSMPYLNTQVALAGYADLVLAACYLAALAAFCNWVQGGERWQGLLALGFALCLPLLKNEGFYWALSLLPGLLVARIGLRRGLQMGLGLLLGLIVMLIALPADMVIAGHSLGSLQISYRPQSWGPIVQSLFLHDNWHLLAYLFPLLLLAVGLSRRDQLARYAPGIAAVSCAFALYLALYLLTRHAHGAEFFTSLNRVALQIMPAIGFVAALLYSQLLTGRNAG